MGNLELKLDTEIYVIAIVAAVIALFLLTYVFICKHKNNKFENSNVFKTKDNLLVQISKENGSIKVYNRQKAIRESYQYDEFLKLIVEEDRTKIEKWMDGIQTNLDKQSTSILIKITKDNKTFKIFKIEYLDFNDQTLYAIANETDERTRVNIESSKNLKINDLSFVYSSLDLAMKDKKIKSYTFYCIGFDKYDIILNRYGQDTCDTYVKRAYSLVEQVVGDDCYVSCIEKDKFLVATTKTPRTIQQLKYISRLEEELTTVIYVDLYQFDIRPTIGISNYGAYSTKHEKVKEEAYQACLNSSKFGFKYFDSRLAAKLRKQELVFKEYSIVKNNLHKYIVFRPVVSLINERDIGYLVDFDFTQLPFNNFENLMELAKENKDEYGLLQTVCEEIFSSAELKNKKNLFILSTIRFYKILLGYAYKHKEEFDYKLNILFIDYNEFYNYQDSTYGTFVKGKDEFKMKFGVIGHELMKMSLSKLFKFFTWLVVPKQISSTISKDNEAKQELESILFFTNRYDLKILATDMNSYNNAIVLKEMGVDFMEGPLMDERGDSDYVQKRKASKLFDEEGD